MTSASAAAKEARARPMKVNRSCNTSKSTLCSSGGGDANHSPSAAHSAIRPVCAGSESARSLRSESLPIYPSPLVEAFPVHPPPGS